MVTEVTNMDFIRKGNVLVDFYTATCGPCKAMHPILEELSTEFKDLKVAKVDVTQNPDVSQMFGIMSVPTIIFMTDCQVKQEMRGFSNKERLKTMVRQCING
jgi:thioredoxin 1